MYPAVATYLLLFAAQDSAAFVTRLGNDTLVVERFVRGANRFDADVVTRVPRTNRIRYVLELSPSGELTRLETVGSSPARREVITRQGDSLRIETTDTGATRIRMVAAERPALPFLNLVHWPFELVLMRAKASGESQRAQPLLGGSSVAMFDVSVLGRDSMTITHPTRGTMRVRVDAAGRILALDAGATTLKLAVERRAWRELDLDALGGRWSALDAAGRSLGALSGRRTDTATVSGATIIVEHGTPAKRGRAIWGTVVPFGQVWRTGANRATHFSTDRELVLGAGHARVDRPGREIHPLFDPRRLWWGADRQPRHWPGGDRLQRRARPGPCAARNAGAG